MDNSSSSSELSWVFSILSNGIFLFVFMPQFYENYINKDGNSISLILLFCLVFGDFLSLISGVKKGIPSVIIYSSIYHIFLDYIIISQIVYYRKYKRLNLQDEETSPLISVTIENKRIFTNSEYIFMCIGYTLIGILAIIFNFQLNSAVLTDILVDIVAWLATAIFIVSRIPQIILNFKRKSIKGLSIYSFILINVCNVFFLLSILINLREKEDYNKFLLYNIQWLCGGFCTIFLDLIIFYQFYIYREL